MAQTNPLTFSILQDLAQKSLDSASMKLKKTQDAYQNAQAQLNMLEGYYKEYQQRLNDHLVQGTNRHTLSNFQFFMGTVEKSIVQQKQVMLMLSEQRRQCQQRVYECQKKVNAYAILCEKQQKILVQRENKLQQKQTDEFAQQQSARKSAYEHEHH